MSSSLLTDDVRTALARAVAAAEAVSSIEVVVAVRGRSAPYRTTALVAGALVAFVALAFTLFAPIPFSLWSILLDPLAVGALVAIVVGRLPTLVRAATPRGVQEEAVLRAARATFLEKEVHRTRGRTGILVYVSLLERRVELVADVGVRDGAPPSVFAACEAAFAAAVQRGDGPALARAIADLGTACASTLPCDDHDIDELPNEVCWS